MIESVIPTPEAGNNETRNPFEIVDVLTIRTDVLDTDDMQLLDNLCTEILAGEGIEGMSIDAQASSVKELKRIQDRLRCEISGVESSGKKRRGTTLVELLVTIGIIGTLIALLLPAVQSAREAARRAECGSNLRQIGVGLQNYHDAYKTYPPGKFGSMGVAGWGWGRQLLPFLEQGALHDSLPNGGTMPTPPSGALARALPVYRCPSDTGPDSNTSRNCFGLSSYIGSGGVIFASGIPLHAPGLFSWAQNIALKMTDIRDGLSHTISVGERSWRVGKSAVWAGDTATIVFHNGSDNTGHALYREPINAKNSYGAPFVDTRTWGYRSEHPGGVEFARLDGSVDFVSEETQVGLSWNAMGPLAKQIIPNDGFPSEKD